MVAEAGKGVPSDADVDDDPASVADVEALLPAKGQQLAVFGDQVKVDELLERVVAAAKARIPEEIDMTIGTHRDAVRGAARFIASSKRALDKAGLQLTENMRNAVGRVNRERDRIKEELGKQQRAIRQPLTDWEWAEDVRVKELYVRMAEFWPDVDADAGTGALAGEIRRIQDIPIDDTWQEKKAEAALRKDAALAELRRLWPIAEKREADAAELERLRAAEARRQVEEEAAAARQREEEQAAEKKRLADEAEANAKKAEADRQAQLEQAAAAAAERARKDAEDAAAAKIAAAEEATAKAEELARSMALAAQKERDEAAARATEQAEKAAKDKADAIEAERQRAAAERKREADLAEKAAANKQKRAAARALIVAAIDRAILDTPVRIPDPPQEGYQHPVAEIIADALMAGEVPHMRYEP